jgi:hypothetical protein
VMNGRAGNTPERLQASRDVKAKPTPTIHSVATLKRCGRWNAASAEVTNDHALAVATIGPGDPSRTGSQNAGRMTPVKAPIGT